MFQRKYFSFILVTTMILLLLNFFILIIAKRIEKEQPQEFYPFIPSQKFQFKDNIMAENTEKIVLIVENYFSPPYSAISKNKIIDIINSIVESYDKSEVSRIKLDSLSKLMNSKEVTNAIKEMSIYVQQLYLKYPDANVAIKFRYYMETLTTAIQNFSLNDPTAKLTAAKQLATALKYYNDNIIEFYDLTVLPDYQ